MLKYYCLFGFITVDRHLKCCKYFCMIAGLLYLALWWIKNYFSNFVCILMVAYFRLYYKLTHSSNFFWFIAYVAQLNYGCNLYYYYFFYYYLISRSTCLSRPFHISDGHTLSLSTQDMVIFQKILYRICGGQNTSATDYSLSTSDIIYHFIDAPNSYSSDIETKLSRQWQHR